MGPWQSSRKITLKNLFKCHNKKSDHKLTVNIHTLRLTEDRKEELITKL